MTGPGDEGFLGRWSRRKRQGAEDADDAETAPAPEAADAVDAPPDERTDEEILAELELPEPETMSEGDDFSAFMNSAVPARLRNRALRRLWLTNPVLANLDEMVDYGEDFTDAATVVENLQTAWKVGKGLMPDEPDPEADLPADEIADAEEIPPDEKEAAPDETAQEHETPAPPEESELPDPVVAEAELPLQDDPVGIAAPRRMRFRFESG